MSSDRWLTHAEAADYLGLTIGSLRNRARIEGWTKRTDNQGVSTFLVPSTAAAKGQKSRPGSFKEADHAEQSPEMIILQQRVVELEAALASKEQELAQARMHGQRENERGERLALELADAAQREADVTILRGEVDAERARADALEVQNRALRAQKDDRISLLERLIAWHRKSWFRKMFEDPPVVWLSGDRIPNR